VAGSHDWWSLHCRQTEKFDRVKDYAMDWTELNQDGPPSQMEVLFGLGSRLVLVWHRETRSSQRLDDRVNEEREMKKKERKRIIGHFPLR
jgi:hypothetical protein